MRSIRALVAAGTAVSLLACGTTSSHAAEVTYLTSFNTFGRDAYVYVAMDKGYFAEAGLQVTVKPGTGSVDVMKLVASGRADFGAADFSTVAVTVANEKLPVVSVAMVQQRTLAAIVALQGRGIAKPADLAGKKVADQPGSTNQVLFPTYAEAAGFDPKSVAFVPSSPPSLPQLLASGQVDAIGQFVVGKGLIEAAAQGRAAVVLPYGDVLPDLYGNVIVTSKSLAAEQPEKAKKFTGALLRGLEYSIAHPEESGEILRKHQPTQQPAVAAGEVTAMRPFVGKIGAVDRERVARIIASLRQAGAITADVTPDQLVDFRLVPGATS